MNEKHFLRFILIFTLRFSSILIFSSLFFLFGCSQRVLVVGDQGRVEIGIVKFETEIESDF